MRDLQTICLRPIVSVMFRAKLYQLPMQRGKIINFLHPFIPVIDGKSELYLKYLLRYACSALVMLEAEKKEFMEAALHDMTFKQVS